MRPAVKQARTRLGTTQGCTSTTASNTQYTSTGMMSVSTDDSLGTKNNISIDPPSVSRKDTMKPEEISTLIAESNLTLEKKLSWHFSNFDPAVPSTMLLACIQAIAIANSKGDLSTMIDLPEGSTFYGESKASAQDIIEGHELQYFVTGGSNE